jgi:hypothetical protein
VDKRKGAVVDIKNSLARLGERAEMGVVNAVYLGFIGLYRVQAYITNEGERDQFEDATARSKDGSIVYFAAKKGEVQTYHPGIRGLLSALREEQSTDDFMADRDAAERSVAVRERVLEHLHQSHD